MTVRLIFKGDVPASLVDEALLPPGGGHAIDVSSGSLSFARHDVTIISQGGETIVRIDGVGQSELSANTEQSIIDAVPTTHLKTEAVK